MVQHAQPALMLTTFKTFLDTAELTSFHRPRLFVPKQHCVQASGAVVMCWGGLVFDESCR